jgi:hypothetical protein
VTLTNNQTSAGVTISGISVTGDFVQTGGNCGASLAAATSCSINVAFTPTVSGYRTGTLTINTSAGVLTVSLSGNGIAPVTVSPTSLYFYSVVVGATSSSQAVTVTNNQTSATLTIGSMSVAGDFAQASTTCGASLSAGASCTVNLVFKPTVTGYRSGSLSVPTSSGTQTVSLSGNGITAVTVSPTTLYFGSVVTGASSSAQVVSVTNNQTSSAVSISGVSLVGDFKILTNNCGSSLAASASCSVSVNFTPTANGYRTGSLTINTSAGALAVSLSGNGIAPVTVSPTSLYFYSVVVGATSGIQNVTVTNNQSATAVTISGVSVSGDFAVTTNNCSSTLPAASSCTISLNFTPTATGYRTGTLTVNTSSGTQTVSLSGNGITAVTVSPTTLYFGSLVVGGTSGAQTITVTNNQSSTSVTISSIGLSGDFAQVGGNCSGVLTGGASCTVSVVFKPTALGYRTGTLTITDSAPNSPQTVSLSGNCIAQVTASPTSIYFGSVAVGTTSAAKAITVTNNLQSQSVTISGISATQNFSVSSTTCGSSLAAGASCVVNVVFKPNQNVYTTGTLSITDSANNSPQTVSLSGNGV